MLNPIDTDKVIRDGGATGRFPDEMHPAAAWWLAACFVVTLRADQLVVAHDGQPATAKFFDLLCQGAINAQHYASRILDLGVADEDELVIAMKEADRAPGMRVTTTVDQVTITLYDRAGVPLTERPSLYLIRRMIAEDRIPLPVNAECKGSIQPYAEAAQ
ncbi:hypothetical protein AB0D46_24600 [Streptomyces sp. NPDC048383]|uniref:hypothetical protein n=1 Tax=Streptomyces sp. NPDC048383 TaxID=3155386 RepID=UPI00343F5C26